MNHEPRAEHEFHPCMMAGGKPLDSVLIIRSGKAIATTLAMHIRPDSFNHKAKIPFLQEKGYAKGH